MFLEKFLVCLASMQHLCDSNDVFFPVCRKEIFVDEIAWPDRETQTCVSLLSCWKDLEFFQLHLEVKIEWIDK